MAKHSASLLAPDEQDDVYDPPKFVAREMDCSENYLAKLRMKGDGPPFVKVGKLVRYPRRLRRAWLRDRTFTSTSGTRPAA